MEWSTKPCENGQPFGSWADDLAAAFVRLEPRKLADHPFEGAINRVDANPVNVSLVSATRHSVMRLRSHISDSTDDLCFVNLQLNGLGRTTQRRHEQICAPGDLAVVTTTEPFEIANGRDFRLFCFAVPARLLPPEISERPHLRLSATATGRALSRTLASYAELCLNSHNPATLGLIGAHVVDLITHAAETLAEESAERMAQPVLLSMMIDHIDRHSGDPDLNAASLAGLFRCSQRYVHRLFAGTGRSVSEHVNDRRLSACARDLLDRSSVRKTVAEIAFAAGFRDLSHFNRLFRRSNGMSPRDFRNGNGDGTHS